MSSAVRIVNVRQAGEFRLWLLFDDGLAGTVDLAGVIELDHFWLLRDRRVFRTVRVGETGELWWPQAGIRLSPSILHRDMVARDVSAARRDTTFQRFLRGVIDGPA